MIETTWTMLKDTGNTSGIDRPSGLQHTESLLGIIQRERQTPGAFRTPIYLTMCTAEELDGRMGWKGNNRFIADGGFVVPACHITRHKIFVQTIMHGYHKPFLRALLSDLCGTLLCHPVPSAWYV